jgi:signal transduction histidine kinase
VGEARPAKGHLKRREVVECIADDVVGYRWAIEEAKEIMDDWRSDGSAVEAQRESIIADKQAIKALRRLSKKLGVWEEVEAAASEEA